MATIAIDGVEKTPDDARPESTPILRLGFRPFYLLEAAFAAVSVPLWKAHFYGWVNLFGNVAVATCVRRALTVTKVEFRAARLSKEGSQDGLRVFGKD